MAFGFLFFSESTFVRPAWENIAMQRQRGELVPIGEVIADLPWNRAAAWQGVARLLLSCEVWRQGWQSFHGVVVYREANDFRAGARGPNVVMRRADALTGFLATELGVSRLQVIDLKYGCNEKKH